MISYAKRIGIATFALLLGACVITNGHVRPPWSPNYVTMRYDPAPAGEVWTQHDGLIVMARWYEGSPLPGTTVTLVDAAGNKINDATAVDGIARFRLRPGRYRLRVEIIGMGVHRRTVEIREDATCVVDVAFGYLPLKRVTVV